MNDIDSSKGPGLFNYQVSGGTSVSSSDRSTDAAVAGNARLVSSSERSTDAAAVAGSPGDDEQVPPMAVGEHDAGITGEVIDFLNELSELLDPNNVIDSMHQHR